MNAFDVFAQGAAHRIKAAHVVDIEHNLDQIIHATAGIFEQLPDVLRGDGFCRGGAFGCPIRLRLLFSFPWAGDCDIHLLFGTPDAALVHIARKYGQLWSDT